jgi:predicted transcriptional regulator
MDRAVNQSPPGWAEILDEGIAEIARGEVVPASKVHKMIQIALAELEAEMFESPKPKRRSSARY